MEHLWILAAAAVLLFVFARMRGRRRPRASVQPPAGPRVQGAMLGAYVHPRMSAACLHDDGVQFGKGFRRKEGPSLPHDAACGCEVKPFAFTSSEVFNGALRSLRATRCSIPDLPPPEIERLVDGLRRAEAQWPATDAQAYAAAVGVEAFPAPHREAVGAFLAERWAFLQSGATGGDIRGDEAGTAHGGDPTDDVEPGSAPGNPTGQMAE